MGMGAIPVHKTKDLSMVKPFYAKFKKHSCSKCNGNLKIIWITHHNIKKGSPESYGKYIRFDLFNHPVDYTFAIFECERCSHRLSILDQYFIEKPEKLEKYNKKYGDYRLKDDYHNYKKFSK